MRVYTKSGQLFDLTLSGKESKYEFNTKKYEAIAYDTHWGKLLMKQVKDHWCEWLKMVDEMPCLKYWKRSDIYNCNKRDKGYGAIFSTDEIEELEKRYLVQSPNNSELCYGPGVQYKIASVIFTEAVWGFGFGNWTVENGYQSSKALNAIKRLQKVDGSIKYRTYVWDERLYLGCGLLIPYEFGMLDDWLESLWVQLK